MFEQLFGSKTRVKLLRLFYNNPSRSFYVRELTRKISEQINSVRRELANMLSVGIIKSRTENNKLYYYLNKEFEFFGDFKNIFSKISTELADEDKFTKRIRQVGRIEYAQLSGFFVSDSNCSVDILLVGEVNRSLLNEFVKELEAENNRELNFSVLTSEEFNYRKMLYDKFLAEILESPKIVLIDETKAKAQNPASPEQVKEVQANA